MWPVRGKSQKRIIHIILYNSTIYVAKTDVSNHQLVVSDNWQSSISLVDMSLPNLITKHFSQWNFKYHRPTEIWFMDHEIEQKHNLLFTKLNKFSFDLPATPNEYNFEKYFQVAYLFINLSELVETGQSISPALYFFHFTYLTLLWLADGEYLSALRWNVLLETEDTNHHK